MKVLKRNFYKIVSCVLAFTIFLTPCVFAIEKNYWDNDTKYYNNSNGRLMPFRPAEGYVSIQNPPSFTWGKAPTAKSYDLKICYDREMTKVAYEKKGLENNFYNFPHTFETGVYYYWSVRVDDLWSTPRKFRIDPDATEYIVPSVDDMLANIPESHPRIWVTEDTLAEFRNYKNENSEAKEIYDYWIKSADDILDRYQIDEEPEDKVFDDATEQTVFNLSLNQLCGDNSTRALKCAWAYLMSGDKKYVRYVIDALLETASWDPYGISSHARQDQVNRLIMYQSAMAYDWCYYEFTDEQRKIIRENIEERCKQMDYLIESIPNSPYDSHGWGIYSWLGLGSIVMYGENDMAEARLRKILPGYAAISQPYSYQDGGWSQGTAYWSYSTETSHSFMEILNRSGILNIYDSAWGKNEYLWSLYAYPPGSYGSFGDESGRALSGELSLVSLIRPMYFTQNPITKWLVGEYGGAPKTKMQSYIYANTDVEAVVPTWYQLSHEFSDVGWIAMTNDLVDKNRIQMTFKSSPYGSYNHSMADQNGIFLQAYGYPLIARAGYYDSYHSVHDIGITRKTFSNNSVTYRNGKGQVDDNFNAKGHLAGYLTQLDFDLAKGDATEAYMGNIDKFERSVIYIRPDMFVVVDDLKAKGKEKTEKFEWNLNSRTPIEVYEGSNGARITNGTAILDVAVHYPQNVTTYYNDIFAGPNMVEIKPGSRYVDSPVDTRVWFETEAVNSTKMIVTLDVHKIDEEAECVITEYYEDYAKLSFKDGTVMFVNLGESTNQVVCENGISFIGEIVVYNDRSIMLVNGTSVSEGSKELICLEKPGSVVMGADELSFSTYEDNKISINKNNDYVSKIDSITDYNGRPIGAEYGIIMEDGVLTKSVDKKKAETTYFVEENSDYVTFTMDADNYELMLNGKIYSKETVSEIVTGSVEVVIDGKSEIVETIGYKGRDGKYSLSANFDFGGEKFKCIEKNTELVCGKFVVGSVETVSVESLRTSVLEGNKIVLETIPTITLNTRTEENYNSIKDNMTVFIEAEDIINKWPSGTKAYESVCNLSGADGKKIGVTGFNTIGTTMNYTVEIKEEGDYDFAVKYVAWNDGGASRMFTLNGRPYIFNMEKTFDWGTKDEYWRACVSNDAIHLMPGTYELVMEPILNSWNFDWFGFVKR